MSTDEIVITDDSKTETKKPTEPSVNEIDALLSEYTQALNVDSESGDNSHENKGDSDGGIDWDDKSNPKLYYQSGKKKGQRRPNAAKISRKEGSENAQTTIGGDLITGAMFITMIDLLLPLGMAALNNHFSDKKVDANKLKLTAKQRNDLAPVCDDLAKQWQITANPVAVLIVSLIGIYGVNLLMLRNES